MTHSIEVLNESIIKSLTIEDLSKEKKVCFSIDNEFIVLDLEDLHSLIGTLLHVQSKLRGGKNG